MPSARMAQASGSPPGSFTICCGDARRQDQGLAELEREIFDVGGEGRHLQGFDRAHGARFRDARRRLQRGVGEAVQDRDALAGLARKNMS